MSNSSKKYEFTGEIKKLPSGVILKQIRRLSNRVIGGWIEKEENLSHEGNCWVSGNALVYGYAKIYENAQVFENAEVLNNARVLGHALVYGYAQISEDARVSENAHVYGNAWVFGYARVYGNARVFEYALVLGNAQVYGKAQIRMDKLTTGKINENPTEKYIAVHMGILPSPEGFYTLYKTVGPSLESKYDSSFIYKIGQWIEANTVNEDSTVSCGGGLHISTPLYWEKTETDRVIECVCHIDDVLAALDGKLRVRKLFVRREVFID